MNHLFRFFYIFILGSILGFASEASWCIFKFKKYESRKGLIYGFYIPIYGIAAVLISTFYELLNIKSNIVAFIIFLFVFLLNT